MSHVLPSDSVYAITLLDITGAKQSDIASPALPFVALDAQYVIKEHITQRISIGNLILFLSKQTKFLVFQIAQHTTARLIA
jgi:hypothetical protein